VTPEQYFAFERKAEFKSEYFDGRMYPMAGANEQHIIIVANLICSLVAQLKGRSCKAYSNDMRVRVSETGLCTYPDVVVVSGEPLFYDEHKDTLLNPAIIIEVLSESTEAYDRGEKFEHYRTIESLSDYLLVAQDKPRIEHLMRLPNNKWFFSEDSNIQESIEIPSIACNLALADVYDKTRIINRNSP
jgi:Uma2 family endonuclease